MRLAKVELTEQVDRVRKVAGFLGAAVIVGLLAGMCLVATCVALLALLLPLWAAGLIVTLLLAGAGAGLFLRGRRKMRIFRPFPEHTVQAIKDDVKWVKQRTR
jgi:uncharacterized membrane protein YqjE